MPVKQMNMNCIFRFSISHQKFSPPTASNAIVLIRKLSIILFVIVIRNDKYDMEILQYGLAQPKVVDDLQMRNDFTLILMNYNINASFMLPIEAKHVRAINVTAFQ